MRESDNRNIGTGVQPCRASGKGRRVRVRFVGRHWQLLFPGGWGAGTTGSPDGGDFGEGEERQDSKATVSG